MAVWPSGEFVAPPMFVSSADLLRVHSTPSSRLVMEMLYHKDAAASQMFIYTQELMNHSLSEKVGKKASILPSIEFINQASSLNSLSRILLINN